ncbi:aquaporin Z [Marmoricola sp. URHB0036]|uniref:aquaporin Z n=1 Tax=Marmoricola sp. URHB0036 TaxID=1298863 RepID=UPI0004205264|nr:aquaporin Z [Marmoricola sp. URHB0036]
MYSMRQRLAAELFGTFWLVLGGCGTAVLAGSIVKNEGVALAFGLTVVTMAYAVGHISGGHFNPAITIGLAAGKRFDWREVPAYVVTQVVGAIVAAGVLLVIANGTDGFDIDNGFATNGYGDHSPGGYSLLAVIVAEVVLTAFFLYVILGVTDTPAPKGFAPLAIGLALTLIHLISIPVSNTSVNPARSIGPAVFAGGDALTQLWVFLVAPVVGGLIAGASYAGLFGGGLVAPLEEATEG